jgi:plastocyanin
MTSNPRLRRTIASAVLLTTLLLGACGGDDETGDGADTSGTASAGATDESSTEEADGGETGDAVEIVDFDYKPANLAVKAGTTVTFTNVDTFAHTVTAKDKSFDSGNMDEGATFEHTFAEAGTFEYLCAIHNSMTGKVTVS